MLKAKLRWPSAVSACVAVTAELICDAVPVVRPLIWYTALPAAPLSPAAPGVSCPFPCFISTARPMLQWQVSKPSYYKPEPHLWQLNKNAVLIICWWAVPSIEVQNSCMVRALKSRKHFIHLPSGISTEGSMQLLFSVFALPSTQWYPIGFQG